MKKIEYSVIAAVSENFVIGDNQKIPWHIPEDFKLFKERTLNSVVIMGKNTYDSLPIKPLPNRVNIVVSKEKLNLSNGAICVTSLEEAFLESLKYNKEIFVIGGASIYNQTIEAAKYLYISHVNGEFTGNIFFPRFDIRKYKIVEEKEFEKFVFRKYERL